MAAAKELRLKPPLPIKNQTELLKSLLDPNWRAACMQFDIPANSQIFGQLVANAGIEGILYSSKYTKSDCLAIFPQNFCSDSFIAVDGDSPPGAIVAINESTWPIIKITF
jgi:hypothetical protein